MFCFFVNLDLEAAGVGEDERLRFVVLVVVVVTVVVACWSAEVEESDEVEERLVLAAEGFCAEVAWSVTLESLEIWVGLVVTTLVVLVTVGFGGLEKSISEESLSDEVDSDADDEDEDAFAFVVDFVVSVGSGASSSDSLPDDELCERDFDCAIAAAVVAAAGLEGSAVDSLSDDEVSEDEELTDGLGSETSF